MTWRAVLSLQPLLVLIGAALFLAAAIFYPKGWLVGLVIIGTFVGVMFGRAYREKRMWRTTYEFHDAYLRIWSNLPDDEPERIAWQDLKSFRVDNADIILAFTDGTIHGVPLASFSGEDAIAEFLVALTEFKAALRPSFRQAANSSSQSGNS